MLPFLSMWTWQLSSAEPSYISAVGCVFPGHGYRSGGLLRVHSGVPGDPGRAGWGWKYGQGPSGVREAHPGADKVQRERKEADVQMQGVECKDRVHDHESRRRAKNETRGWNENELSEEGKAFRSLEEIIPPFMVVVWQDFQRFHSAVSFTSGLSLVSL